MWSKALVTLSALALMACQQGAESVTGSTSASPLSASVSPLDGTYRGDMILTRRDGNCGFPRLNQALQVSGARASMIYNSNTGGNASGSVAADGSFSLFGGYGTTSVVVSGKIEDEVARGTFSATGGNVGCSFDIALRKVS